MKTNEVIFYLVGQITADPETYNWRRRIRERFNEHEKIKFFDPCNNTFSKGVLEESHGKVDGFKNTVILNKHASIIPVRDASFVSNSDGAIANLNIYTPEKPLIGTFFELAWYSLCFPEKLVIGILDGNPEEVFQCRHPFVWKAVHTWVKNEEEAGDLLLDFYT
jgi:hypothetical protein